MRVAAIDIGTNSVLLLVAERKADGAALAILERATVTRLGQGVDRTRTLAPEAIERTLACLATYGELAREAGVTRIDAVGTSAMRDAKGGEAFVARARDLLGTAPRVVSGEEEAALTCEGALSGLRIDGPATIFDVGGGSTEIIRRTSAGKIASAVSLDVGSVRLTERHVRSDPPSHDELERVRADVRGALARVSFSADVKATDPRAQSVDDETDPRSRSVDDKTDPRSRSVDDKTDPRSRSVDATVVGVAGTVTTLAAHALGVAPYDGARVHGTRLTRARVRSLAAELAKMTLAERRALPALDPGRADVIVAGAILVDEILEAAGAPDLVVSDRGVRWGLALRLFRLAK